MATALIPPGRGVFTVIDSRILLYHQEGCPISGQKKVRAFSRYIHFPHVDDHSRHLILCRRTKLIGTERYKSESIPRRVYGMPRLDRRTFLGLCSACAVLLTRTARPQNIPKAVVNKSAVKSRKDFVALQVKPFSWVDEGI